MEYRKGFFGEDGITSTSANFIANMAKEMYLREETRLESLKMYNKYMTVVGQAECLAEKGIEKDGLDEIKSCLNRISQLKSLIAYLREAIKEKTKMSESWSKDWDQYYELGINRPVKEEYITEDKIKSSWSVGKIKEYLQLETECAVLGKAIHPSGNISNARKDAAKSIVNPISLTEGKTSTIVWRVEPSLHLDDVDSMFFSLQKEHREKQARLNGIKAEIERQIKDDKYNKDKKYSEALEEYNRVEREYTSKFNLLSQEKLKDIESLKIVIPNDYKELVAEINSNN